MCVSVCTGEWAGGCECVHVHDYEDCVCLLLKSDTLRAKTPLSGVLSQICNFKQVGTHVP